MKIIAVYSGRFQPFGPHHKSAFDWMCSKFGSDNCWVATSNSVDARSPLSFDEKCEVIKKYGIDNVVLSDNPYRPIIPNVDRENTALIIMLGAKDEGRIKYFKSDGTAGYFREYFGQLDLEPMSKCGYVVIAPHQSIKHNGNEISGTYIRKTLPFAPQSTFIDLMGFYDPYIDKLFQNRFGGEIDAMMDMFSPSFDYGPNEVGDSPTISTSRHIRHLYEASLSGDEIVSVLRSLSEGKIPAYEKFDGINLKVGNRGGELVCARNKSDMLNPVDIFELADRYIGRPSIRKCFMDGYRILANHSWDLGDNWLNIEILHPDINSVYRYREYPVVVVHGLVDSSNKKVNKKISIPVCNDIWGPNPIKLPKMPLYLSQMASQFKYKAKHVELIDNIGYVLLNHATGYKAGNSSIPSRLSDISREVMKTPDSKIRKRYFEQLEKLNASKILPFEGIVFEYKGSMFKLTGYYRYINAILHIFD